MSVDHGISQHTVEPGDDPVVPILWKSALQRSEVRGVEKILVLGPVPGPSSEEVEEPDLVGEENAFEKSLIGDDRVVGR